MARFSNFRIALFALTIFSTAPVHAQIAGAVTTGVAVSQISSGLNELINKARDTGDYLTMRAAVEAKDVIERWRDANKELLETAFSKLDEKQQRIFSNARQLTEFANASVEDRLKNTREIVNQANQLAENIVPGTGNTYVTQFSPRVLPPQTTTSINLKVTGVNLDKGDPVLSLTEGAANRMLVGPLEVVYVVPASAMPRQPDKLSVAPLTLTYSTPKDGFWNWVFRNREQVVRQLPIVTLPAKIATFSFVAETTTETKEVEIWTAQEQEFSGKNENVPKVATPREGWRWDLSQGVNSFKQVQGRGEAGSCNGVIEANSKPDGITHQAHLDMIKEVKISGIKWGPGWVMCSLKGPIFRMTKVKAKLPVQTASLSWTEDLRIPLPPETSAFALEVTTFDGRKRLFTDTGNDKFFDVTRSGQDLIIRPKPPTDL
ncbi:hypothetical protein [Acidovorax sp.]|uniref:hypothetical protein n=1 Tax=Acidovorax sp. TaxID=1872122 RepID=UPI00391F5DB6